MMAIQENNNEKQKNNTITSKQDSGSEYHREHAGNVEGYGETEPYVKGLTNMTEKNDQ
jgi:hypothetical protein